MVTESGGREKSAAEGLVGIFVGGRSSRMGYPKGLLRESPDAPTLLEQLVKSAADAALESVLVGDASAYAEVTPPWIAALDDDPPGIGPLGGLRALLDHAGSTRVISLGCDMPRVDAELLRALFAHPSSAPALSVRRTDEAPWEPMLTRWDATAVLPVLDEVLKGGVRSFQGLFAELEVARFAGVGGLEEALRDWDTPEDVREDGGVLPSTDAMDREREHRRDR